MQLTQGELGIPNVLEHRLEDCSVTRAIQEGELLGDSDEIDSGQRFDINIDDIRAVAPRSASDVGDRRRRGERCHELRYELASVRRAVRQFRDE